MYFKIAGALFVILASSGIGFGIAGDLQKKLDLLIQMRKMLTMIAGEIRYLKAPLWEVFGRIAPRLEAPYGVWAESLATRLEMRDFRDFRGIWEEEANIHLSGAGLRPKDFRFLKDLGSQLGYLDIEMQQGVLEQLVKQLDFEIDEVHRQIGGKKKLCHSLGIAGGFFVVVILF